MRSVLSTPKLHQRISSTIHRGPVHLVLSLFLILVAACERPDPQTADVTFDPVATEANRPTRPAVEVIPATEALETVSPQPILKPTYVGSPTPDPTRTENGVNDLVLLSHQVVAGETLGLIAQKYGTTIDELLAINGLEGGDILFVGQAILVPGTSSIVGPSFKLIPDSEAVYGPSLRDFNTSLTVTSFGGYLDEYREDVEGKMLSGAEIVQLVANRQSINPRLLLAIIEYKSGWLTGPEGGRSPYPLGFIRNGYEGLYQQVTWAANQLSLGYYGHAEGGVDIIDIGDSARIAFAPTINSGTAGMQLLLGAAPEITHEGWLQDVGPEGFYATYKRLFGIPFAYTLEPLWPSVLNQPPLSLPWSGDEIWYFTGGPHGGWASGSAWAALDFTPADENVGCNVANEWIVAVADGVISRSEFGSIVLDLDGDGFAGTGWAVIYLHVAAQERIPSGTFVRTGEKLGHPSCEGGFSNWTHLHIARTYNGRWVSADGPYPFILGGWQSQGLGREYDGLLLKGNEVKEACECRQESNAITAN